MTINSSPLRIRWELPDQAPPWRAYWPMIAAWLVGMPGYLLGASVVPAGHWRVLAIGGVTAIGAMGVAWGFRRTTEPATWDGRRLTGQRSGLSVEVTAWVPMTPGLLWGGKLAKALIEGVFVWWALSAWPLPGSLVHAFVASYTGLSMSRWRWNLLAICLGMVIPMSFGAPWSMPYQALNRYGQLVAT
ncbi:MAG: hypothetical protein OWQ57_03385, partial [Sulfobacillus sp.]|nr:hypothetical protein [Sulfobacillus sp.]